MLSKLSPSRPALHSNLGLGVARTTAQPSP